MEKQKVNYVNVEKALIAAKGRIFTVSFIKKTTKEKRVMTARLGVKKYLKGGSLPYNPKNAKVIPVFDVIKKDYRMISVDNLIDMTIEGKKYTFNN